MLCPKGMTNYEENMFGEIFKGLSNFDLKCYYEAIQSFGSFLFYHLCSKCLKYLNCLSSCFPNESLFSSST